MLVLGEVQTAALMHSTTLSSASAEQVLDLMAGERVRISERPISHAASPDTYTGVDCRVGARSGAQARGIGTLAGRALLTGGRVVQGSVVVRLARADASYRRSWSHYLSRLGVVETIGKADPTGIGQAHLVADRSASTMGMGAVCGRLLTTVQQSPSLDQRPPFKTSRTILRWVARAPAESEQRVRFTVEEDGLRTLWLEPQSENLADLVALCEDLALHDWLLTALVPMIERSRIGDDEPATVVARLRPAVDHLLHLWMPAARLSGPARMVWEALEHRPGLSRQWDASVRRIRDQLAMGAVLLHSRDAQGAGPRPEAGARWW